MKTVASLRSTTQASSSDGRKYDLKFFEHPKEFGLKPRAAGPTNPTFSQTWLLGSAPVNLRCAAEKLVGSKSHTTASVSPLVRASSFPGDPRRRQRWPSQRSSPRSQVEDGRID